MALLPKEHGAYGQLAFPLVTAFAVAGVTMPALLHGGGSRRSFLHTNRCWCCLAGAAIGPDERSGVAPRSGCL